MKKRNKPKVSAIVPVYNEEKNIYGVLSALSSCKQIDEIVCVNDASTDNTLDEVKKVKGITLISHSKNQGKSHAIVTGLLNTKADIVVFIDGDLKGITNKTLVELTQPLIDGTHDVVVGYYNNYTFDEFFRPVSGERAYFRKDLLNYIEIIKNTGYGLELKLNYLFKDKRLKVFQFKNVKHDLKFEKQPYNIVAKLLYRETKDFLNQVISSKDPIDFVTHAYFSKFYFTKHTSVKTYLTKWLKPLGKN